MRSGADIAGVLSSFREGLRELGVPFDDYGVNVVDPQSELPSARAQSPASQEEWPESDQAHGTALVLQFWREGVPAYRRDLEAEDVYDERQSHSDAYGHPVRCILDVPFSHGTVAVNSHRPNAFSDVDIADLAHLALVLEEGFRRRDDLLKLEQRSQDLR